MAARSTVLCVASTNSAEMNIMLQKGKHAGSHIHCNNLLFLSGVVNGLLLHWTTQTAGGNYGGLYLCSMSNNSWYGCCIYQRGL